MKEVLTEGVVTWDNTIATKLIKVTISKRDGLEFITFKAGVGLEIMVPLLIIEHLAKQEREEGRA